MSTDLVFSTVTLTNAAESAANTETVVATLTVQSLPYPNATVHLEGWVKLTAGTTASAVLAQIRKNTLTGTALGETTAETGQVGASKVLELEANADDTPGDSAGLVYVLTVKGTGEGTAATFLAARLKAFVF